MTVYENLLSKSIDELADLIDGYMLDDNEPYILWWDENYCNKCEPALGLYDDIEMEFSWCELNNKCRFFPELDYIPNSKQIIKLWLESEV